MKGKFIVFEGIDGSGKTTQLNLLAEHLTGRGFPLRTTREPGGTRVGEQIREILLNPQYGELVPLAEAFLYAAARAQHVAQVILPALTEGKIVLCDRFIDSSLAYQGFGRGLEVGLLKQVNLAATGGLVPDLVLVLDFSCEYGMDRLNRSGRKIDRIESETGVFHRRVRNGFLALAACNASRYRVIDTCRPVGQVHQDIVRAAEEVLDLNAFSAGNNRS
jgi:dTMP kinase